MLLIRAILLHPLVFMIGNTAVLLLGFLMILDLQQTFKREIFFYLFHLQLNVTVPRTSSSVTTLYANLWPGSATGRTTVGTTLTRTPKSAVRVVPEPSLAASVVFRRRSFLSIFPRSSSQGCSSVLPPELSAVATIACVCKCPRGVTASTAAATARTN